MKIPKGEIGHRMEVKTHPLAEILAKKLFAIETVPKKERRRMITRAIKAAVEFHEQEKINNLKKVKDQNGEKV